MAKEEASDGGKPAEALKVDAAARLAGVSQLQIGESEREGFLFFFIDRESQLLATISPRSSSSSQSPAQRSSCSCSALSLVISFPSPFENLKKSKKNLRVLDHFSSPVQLLQVRDPTAGPPEGRPEENDDDLEGLPRGAAQLFVCFFRVFSSFFLFRVKVEERKESADCISRRDNEGFFGHRFFSFSFLRNACRRARVFSFFLFQPC